jgi:hypothetical protein
MYKKMIPTVVIVGAMLSATLAIAAPFGGSDDVAYSKQLWKVLTESAYVGKHAINGTPYTGQPPHGAILDTIDGEVTVSGNKGAVIVKRNYGGEGVSKETVANNPDEYLKAVTVMFKRSGYDPENKDWFWAKYKPDGSLHTNPKGMMLAGKVAKGMPQGCIACHQSAAGGDFVFNNDRIQ